MTKSLISMRERIRHLRMLSCDFNNQSLTDWDTNKSRAETKQLMACGFQEKAFVLNALHEGGVTICL